MPKFSKIRVLNFFNHLDSRISHFRTSRMQRRFGFLLKLVLQLTASPWTTEASTSERWQFGALTNRKATSSNRAPSLSSLYYYQDALSLYRDKWTTIIRLWWLSQWLVSHGHHLVVTIYLHVALSTDRHITSISINLNFYHLSSTL